MRGAEQRGMWPGTAVERMLSGRRGGAWSRTRGAAMIFLRNYGAGRSADIGADKNRAVRPDGRPG